MLQFLKIKKVQSALNMPFHAKNRNLKFKRKAYRQYLLKLCFRPFLVNIPIIVSIQLHFNIIVINQMGSHGSRKVFVGFQCNQGFPVYINVLRIFKVVGKQVYFSSESNILY